MSVLLPVHRSGMVVAYALVDDEESHLAKYLWRWHGAGYASRSEPSGGTVLLHREIMGLTAGDGLEVDHRNRDKLDCRRSNLRIVTHAENQQNFPPGGNVTWRCQPTSSSVRGVSWDGRRGKWKATVTVGGKTHHLGRFDTEEEAARRAAAFRAEHMPYAADAA